MNRKQTIKKTNELKSNVIMPVMQATAWINSHAISAGRPVYQEALEGGVGVADVARNMLADAMEHGILINFWEAQDVCLYLLEMIEEKRRIESEHFSAGCAAWQEEMDRYSYSGEDIFSDE